jgi:uncharacterized protein YlxW (UPF0749 family)
MADRPDRTTADRRDPVEEPSARSAPGPADDPAPRAADDRAGEPTDEPAAAPAAPPAGAAADPEPGPAHPAAEPADDRAVEPADEPAGDPGPTDSPEPTDGSGSADPPSAEPAPAGRRSGTRLVTAALLALLGFTFAIQVRSVADDPTVTAMGEEDLVRILANLDAHEERLREEIAELQETQRRLTTAGQSQQEALAEAERRADELGILAGTLPAEGPGVVVRLHGGPEAVSATTLLDTVQELRSAGAEVMQVEGAGGTPVRIVASSYFLDRDGGVVVDGTLLRSPFTLTAIGEPQTLGPALHIPGGVVESVAEDGGTVTVREEPGGVEVTAVREPTSLRYARPES